ncbi:unnamed protein product, partial [Meganyctiphanes norvegica]
MAEAQRKRKTRVKKTVQEPCALNTEEDGELTISVQEIKDGEESTSMQEILDEYSDTPLPYIKSEAGTDTSYGSNVRSGQILNDKYNIELENPENKNSVNVDGHCIKEKLDYFKDKESVNDSSPNLEATNYPENVNEAILEEIPPQLDNESLQEKLDKMEPYLQVQKQLNNLKLSEAELESNYTISESNANADNYNTATAPVLEYISEPSAPVFTKSVSEQAVPVASAPEVETQISNVIEKINIKNNRVVQKRVVYSENLIVESLTDIQLELLYQNQQLEENETFITHFLNEESNIPQQEFYELVLGYLRARTGLIGSQKELLNIQKQYKNQKENIWIFEERIGREEGECEDEKMLTVEHKYEVASFKKEISHHVSKLLKQKRDLLADSYALHAYTSEMSKLQVENYMQKILSDCPELLQLTKTSPVKPCSGSQCHPSHLSIQNEKLRLCISVLFAFQRRGIKDQIFIRDTRQWLTDLIAILLRVAICHDHLFIINHIMRCPAGVGTWAASYIQIGGQYDSSGFSTDFDGILRCSLEVNLNMQISLAKSFEVTEDLLMKHTVIPPTSDHNSYLHAKNDNI